MKQNEFFPPKKNKEHGQSIISNYGQQTEDETVDKTKAASQNEFGMLIEVLMELGPAVCEWILEALVDSQ